MSVATNKKKLILDIATQLFTRFGFAKTSLDEIAAAAQIAKGTVYYYFPSKEDLFIASVEAKTREYFTILRQHINSTSGFEEKLTEFLSFPIKLIYENMPILIECLINIPQSYQEQLIQFRSKSREVMMQILSEIIQLGKQEDLIDERFPEDRLCEVIMDWFMVGEPSLKIVDVPRLLTMIERDNDFIIKMLLYGIVKRG
ncbi:MAG TPA: TetR/AcrR family transcriptional regulator [Sedimentibacter sp.]|nr:TetR/AcrR family transcriptional regulator [Sedimentibacter sp.]